ncbi:hypothetical protein GCM10023346_31530 [Arthrobacter gyeryongensis]|uniref:Tautomerase n=1 Tax=Arthrobacter gyeryongensis TaxID=1650592 RepID=A0ABP9SMC4_9MICC
MPSLQLDITADLTALQKQALARDMSEEYSQIMSVDPHLVTVVIRTLPLGSIWHCQEGWPVPGTLLICDLVAGRDRQTRDQLVPRLVDLIAAQGCVARMGIRVEFTRSRSTPLTRMFLPFLERSNRGWDYMEADTPITELAREHQHGTGLQ